MGEKKNKEQVYCPYCEEEMKSSGYPFCQACGLTVFYCPRCRKPVPREEKTCPHCGTDIRREAGTGTD